jgi:hypothetical protein
MFLFFLLGVDDGCCGKSFSMPTRYPRSTTLTTWFEITDDSLYKYNNMPFSFLMICFVDDKTTIVDHKLCLYDIFLFLSRMILLLFPFIYRPWNLLFSRTNESIKSRKKSFNFLWRFQPFGYLYISCGIGMHFLIKLSIF